MIKNVIAPIQHWLLSQGKCVGCGTPLSKGKSNPWKKDKTKNMVTCKCRRMYVHDPKAKKDQYRRALLSEI